jgi:hypothetical protein
VLLFFATLHPLSLLKETPVERYGRSAARAVVENLVSNEEMCTLRVSFKNYMGSDI